MHFMKASLLFTESSGASTMNSCHKRCSHGWEHMGGTQNTEWLLYTTHSPERVLCTSVQMQTRQENSPSFLLSVTARSQNQQKEICSTNASVSAYAKRCNQTPTGVFSYSPATAWLWEMVSNDNSTCLEDKWERCWIWAFSTPSHLIPLPSTSR